MNENRILIKTIQEQIAKKLNINNDIDDNGIIIKSNNKELGNDFIGNFSLTFFFKYIKNEKEVLKSLRNYGFEILEGEDQNVFLYSDKNRKLITKLFISLNFDSEIIEFKGRYLNNYLDFKDGTLIIDSIDFYIPENILLNICENKNLLHKIEKEKQIQNIFQMEKYGIIVDITANFIEFHFLTLSRRLSKESLNLYEKFNINLEKKLDDRDYELINSDENRKNIILFILHIFKINNINIDLKLHQFKFIKSEIFNNKFYIDKIKFSKIS
jgi:hypothetical protein